MSSEEKASQVVRLRSASAGSVRPAELELEQSVTKLRGEIDAISAVLEEVAAPQKSRG